MPLALIISSHVAASHVGGTAQASALSILRIDTMVAPTVLYGRHPGWGPPGGAKVEPAVLEGVLAGIEANKLFGQTDLVLTGYFAFTEQVLAAAAAIDAVRGAKRSGYGGEAPRRRSSSTRPSATPARGSTSPTSSPRRSPNTWSRAPTSWPPTPGSWPT